MEIGKPAPFYPLRASGYFVYVPYNSQDFELVFTGNQDHMDKIVEYWHSIKVPRYLKTKTVKENLEQMYQDLNYWPKPMLINQVVQTLQVEYKNEDR